MGLEFETDASDTTRAEPETMTVDGRVCTYYFPGDGQFALFMANTERRKTDQVKVAALIDFFFSIFDEADQKHFQARLWDRNDPFDIESEGGINDIVDGLVKEWSARPTQRPAGSTTSPPKTGRSSTRRTPA